MSDTLNSWVKYYLENLAKYDSTRLDGIYFFIEGGKFYKSGSWGQKIEVSISEIKSAALVEAEKMVKFVEEKNKQEKANKPAKEKLADYINKEFKNKKFWGK